MLQPRKGTLLRRSGGVCDTKLDDDDVCVDGEVLLSHRRVVAHGPRASGLRHGGVVRLRVVNGLGETNTAPTATDCIQLSISQFTHVLTPRWLAYRYAKQCLANKALPASRQRLKPRLRLVLIHVSINDTSV
jgi:hypothetical protein